MSMMLTRALILVAAVVATTATVAKAHAEEAVKSKPKGEV